MEHVSVSTSLLQLDGRSRVDIDYKDSIIDYANITVSS